MKYIPCTEQEEKEILSFLGYDSFEDFISFVPKDLLVRDKYGISKGFSELELLAHMKNLSSKNQEGISFIGAGAYDKYVPTIVDFLSSRSEFYTAYTPYQAEVSQGTLQYLYEYQSMICSLSGMDAANASLYDGASAVAEAAILASGHNKLNKILVSPFLNHNYLSVLKTHAKNLNLEIIMLSKNNHGLTSFDDIDFSNNDISSIIIQSPNFIGQIEDWSKISGRIKDLSTLLIGVSDPTTLSILNPPGHCGVDIYVGEGQTLGNYLSYGGPYLGLMAVKNSLIRKIPGRIVGKTEDVDGKTGYTLTLQTREQHIRRERATSNICTNQGLIALRATLYLSLFGAEGLRKINELSMSLAYYMSNEIDKIEGFSVIHKSNFINEFLISTSCDAEDLAKKCLNKGYNLLPLSKNEILIAVTEKRTKIQIDLLLDIFRAHK